VKELRFPTELVQNNKRVEVNMRRLGSFISMCTPIQFGAPEGQTRLEAVSRPCFGYPLYAEAPLQDNKGPLITDFDQTLFFNASQSLPPWSTAFNSIQGSVVYTTGQVLDSKQADDLKEISRVVQEQSGLEINTTYQNFYSSFVHTIKQRFKSSMQPLTAGEWGNFSVLSETRKKRDERLETSEELKIFNLHNEINVYVIDQIFSVRPFNLDKPTHLTVPKLMDILEKAENWYTHKYFFTCFQQDLFSAKDKTIPVGYYLPSKLVTSLISSPKTLTLVKDAKMGKLPHWVLVIDLMFAVLCYQPLLDIFDDFLQAFPGTSRYYDPLWLSAYVYSPVRTMSSFYKDYYHDEILVKETSTSMQGKLSPVKVKLYSTFRNIFLMEYFKTIINYGSHTHFDNLDNFISFQHSQRMDYKDHATPSKGADVWIAKNYLEMLLVTLP
jgi:hypothetical protein